MLAYGERMGITGDEKQPLLQLFYECNKQMLLTTYITFLLEIGYELRHVWELYQFKYENLFHDFIYDRLAII